MNCESCRWYEPPLTSLGHCHKNPPMVFGNPDGEYMSDFPEVDPEDWCGQWQEVIDDVTPGMDPADWRKCRTRDLPGRRASGR